MNTLTRSQENLILTLLKRGDSVARIASVVGVRRSDVENVLEKYIAREMKIS